MIRLRRSQIKTSSIIFVLFLLLISFPNLFAADTSSNNPFQEDNHVDVRRNFKLIGDLDSIDGIVDIEGNAQETIEGQTMTEESPGNSSSTKERELINEIKYGYNKANEKLKSGQRPASIIASMVYIKKFADQLKMINPENQWVSVSVDFLTRSITNQIRFGSKQLEKKPASSSAPTVAWLSEWLKASKTMNLSIDRSLIEASEALVKKHQAQHRLQQRPLADNQRGGKILKVPMRNQRRNSVGPAWSCGPTSLGMAMEYLGKNVSSVQLISDCGTNRNGTDHAGMVRGAKRNGFSGAQWVYGQTAAWVRKQIDAGKPVVVNVPNHYMVCIGYDSRGYLIFNDPNGGKELVWSPSHFEANWVHGHAALILQ